MEIAPVRQMALAGQEREAESQPRLVFWLVVLMLCLLPIERLILPASLRPADFALIVLSGYALAKAWRTRQRLELPLIAPMWLIIVAGSVATLVGLAFPESLVAMIQEVYLFSWFILLTNVVKGLGQSDQDRLMKVWVVIASLEAVTTLMGMFRIGPSMFYTLPYRETRITTQFSRATGTFVNPNAAAVYLSVSFFVAMATSWPLVVRSVLGAWLLVGLFATGSNGALMSTFGSLGLLMVMPSILDNRRTAMTWVALLGMGLGLMTGILFLADALSSLLPRLQSSAIGQLLFLTLGRFTHSAEGRAALADWGWQVYRLYPLGVGPNSFGTIQANLHSDYSAFLFERGPLGLAGWVLMIGAALAAPLRAVRQLADGRQRWQALALGAGFLACAINAFSHEISHMRQVWVLLAFLFAVCSTRSSRPASHSPARRAGQAKASK